MIKQYFGKHIDLSRVVAVSGPHFINGVSISCEMQLMDKPVRIYIPSLEGEFIRDIPLDSDGLSCRFEDSVGYSRIMKIYNDFLEDWKECRKLENEVAQSLFMIKEVVETARHIVKSFEDPRFPKGGISNEDYLREDTGQIKELFAFINGDWKPVSFISIDQKKEFNLRTIIFNLRSSLSIDGPVRVKWQDDKYEYGDEDIVYADYSECNWSLKCTLKFNPQRIPL